MAAFRIASYLTDPICKAHEFFRRICVVDALYPLASKVERWARKFFLFLAVVGWAFLALFATGPGMALRGTAAHLQKEPFLSCSKGGGKKLGEDRTFSLLSWNICCVGGGYAISDGGVLPWADRADRVAQEILKKDADVVCLYETFDTASAFYFAEKLKGKYPNIYFNIGPKAVGVSSGGLVASKYKIQGAEFVPFPQEMLVGRTKNAAKGAFFFDLVSDGEPFATVCTTHLQHSEEPAFPTEEERLARRAQMELIAKKVDQIRDRCVVVTGDLNLDDEEYQASEWHHRFEKGNVFGEAKTWGGDAFCAKMVGKRVSGPLNLDHTMVARGSARSIRTSLVETGYDATVFSEKALSDHAGLLSRIQT